MKGANLLVTSVLRSWGLPAMIPVLVLEVLNVRDRVSTSFEYWPTALDSTNGVLIVVNPLVAGIVCAETLALTRGSQREMMNVLPFGGIRLLAVRAAATAAPIILLHLAVIVFVLTQSNTAGSDGLASLFPIVPAVLSVFAYSTIGVALACLFPYLVVAPLAPIALYLLALTMERNLPDPLVEFGGASGMMLGIRNRPDVLAGQTVWLLLIAAVFLMLSVGTVRGYGRLWPRAVVGASVLTVAGFALGSLGDLRFESRPTALVCAGNEPEVCVLTRYADELDGEATRVAAAVQQLETLGVDLPSRFEQGTAAAGADDRSRAVGSFALAREEGAASYDSLILNIIQSVACETDAQPQMRALSSVIEWAKATRGGTASSAREPESQLRQDAEAAMEEIVSCG